jgi:trk system potassium uptake protein TrkA
MRIIVVGCGRVGSGLAVVLAQRGHEVAVVAPDPSACARLGTAFPGAAVAGLGFDRDTLRRAGIDRADGLAAVTGSDEANVVIARVARDVFAVPRVVARVYDPRKARIYQRLGVPTITPVTWGVHRIADLLQYSWLDVVYTLGSGEVDLVEIEVPPLLVGRTVTEVTVPAEFHVTAISRGSRTFLPTLGTVFESGDILHVAVRASSMDRLRTVLGQS